MKIALYGFGAFNASIGSYLSDKYYADSSIEIACWDVDSYVTCEFIRNRIHPYHPSIKFNSKLGVVRNAEELLADANIVILGISAQAIRENLRKVKDYVLPDCIFVIVAKGLEQGSGKRFSEVVREELFDKCRVAVFSGGTIAYDIANKIPLVAEVASTDRVVRAQVAELFHSASLRVYLNPDILSVELAGALKNVISIGAGIVDGIGYGVGTKSSFITRAGYDVYKLAKKMGASDKVFLPGSASFWGDVLLSCFGKTRNLEFGIRIGRGEKVLDVLSEMGKEHKTVEGYATVKAVNGLLEEYSVDAPCLVELYKILYENKDVNLAFSQLMSREQKEL